MQGSVRAGITAQKMRKANSDPNEQLERVLADACGAGNGDDDAESANRAKSAFLASMSHEIRTPMNGVLGMVEVLAQSELGSRQGEALRTIHESANNLLHLIDDILDFSKIEAGRLEIDKQATSLEAVADSVCGTLNAEALAKNVTVNLYVSPVLPAQVMADPLRLRQVFFNLPATPQVLAEEPSTARSVFRSSLNSTDANWIVVTVEDNGIGMSQSNMAHLFPYSPRLKPPPRAVRGTVGGWLSANN